MKSKKNLFGLIFQTLSQIKLVLAGLGFHIKLQKMKPRGPDKGLEGPDLAQLIVLEYCRSAEP
jgi:hypothetical protein